MKKRVLNLMFVLVIIAFIIAIIFSIHKYLITGNQEILITTQDTAYVNEDLYVSILVNKNGEELETESKVKFLDSNKKEVKDAKISYDGQNVIISVPDVETGTYYIRATVLSKLGKDVVDQSVYISNNVEENITINFDKGIYKPGDTINFRALITDKFDDTPIENDVNISIYDGNNNRVYSEDIKSSEFGIVSGTFTLADEINSGTYKLIVTSGNLEVTKQFKVNPYVTPKYEINIDFDKDSYLVDDDVNVTINATYFFGEPAEGTTFVVYLDDEEYYNFISDTDGNATFNFKAVEAKTYNIKVEAEDTSNYYVEETASISVGSDIFEVEVIPEYGSLISNMQNNVYVFTKTADGTPIKTYITVTSDNYTKQVVTDENGIGKFVIDIDSNTNLKDISLTVQNEDGDKVKKDESYDVIDADLLVKTDNVKYNQGDDINVSVSSYNDSAKNIYVLKNDKILKMITTDQDDVTINLDDTYGLIDLYVIDTVGSYSGFYGSDYNYIKNNSLYKRTIFICPDKELNIAVSTDSDEYNPGDDIKISFETTDENNDNVDAALLVSMLDNSVLSLEDNDLSIDNIKLALSDITFLDDLDAATVYSCIVNDEDEATLMALLLKQSGEDLNVSTVSHTNNSEKYSSQITMITLIVILAVIIVGFLCYKFEVIREAVKHLLNLIVVILIIGYSLLALSYSLRYTVKSFYDLEDFGIWIMSILVGIVIYVLIYKFDKFYSKTTLSLLVSLVIAATIFYLYIEIYVKFGNAIMLFVGLAILLIILAIGLFVNRKKEKVRKAISYVIKYIGALILAGAIAIVLYELTYFDYLFIMPFILLLYLFNWLFNLREKKIKSVNDEDDGSEKGKLTKKQKIIIAMVVILLIILLSLIIFIYFETRPSINYDTLDISSRSDSIYDFDRLDNSSSSSSGRNIDVNNYTNSDTNTSSNSSKSSYLDDVMDDLEQYTGTAGEEAVSTDSVDAYEEETRSVVDNQIRQVFLESMCFIPELITENGKIDLDLTLSDNITTWTIQTVGNTLDGRVGYSILDNVKVFKNFFVDFELPTNLVVTDTVSIPVTVYNYLDEAIDVTLNIKDEDWFTLNSENNMIVNVNPNTTQMIYISITVNKAGDNSFTIEAKNGDISDTVIKTASVNSNGYKVETVVSTGIISDDVSEDFFILDDFIKDSGDVTVKIYSSTMAQAVENIDGIFQMPSGCFEQVSSTLYPDILALKYLENTGEDNKEIRDKALEYISSGYQKLLTYEVIGSKGGYSLFGYSPASTVLTAYGLMELTDLSDVYNVDENVIFNMTEFLYDNQNSNGTFNLQGQTYFESELDRSDDLALNAYVTWALSESDPNNSKLEKSVEYLKGKIDSISDNYTLALIANVLANVNDKEASNVIKQLVNNTSKDGDIAYLESKTKDYYGTKGNYQTMQTTALTSMAISKIGGNADINKSLINYIVSQKNYNGTWGTTQATVLALKALNEYEEKMNIKSQTITIEVNSDIEKIEVGDTALDIYEVTFNNLSKENHININFGKGEAYYEVIEEYYIPYENVDLSENDIEVNVKVNTEMFVNDILDAKISIINYSDDDIYNGMVKITIPQGFTVVEDSLMYLETYGYIEKYETSYSYIYLYLEDFEEMEKIDFDISFRASYPVDIVGLAVEVYDYYNPEIRGYSLPISIKVNE